MASKIALLASIMEQSRVLNEQLQQGSVTLARLPVM